MARLPSPSVPRRGVLGGGLVAGAAAAICAGAPVRTQAQSGHAAHAVQMPVVVGEVDHIANGFNPDDILTDFDYGTVSTTADGRTLREYTIVAQNSDLELVPGIRFPAWTYNGRIPGPTLRAREGDLIRINFFNASDHPHGMHFHGIHPANMDGVFEQVARGDRFVYEFDAEPFGLHLYHCHAAPLAKHIGKGLYGTFIVNPKEGRPPVDREMVMVMSGLDIDFDGENDFYMVNGVPFHYDKHPIEFLTGEKIRIYLVNILEFDLANSFHMHANFFHYFPTGTSLTPSEFTDTVALMQGQRGILEFSYRHPGKFMFHAHKTEFAELGWTGFFNVIDAKIAKL